MITKLTFEYNGQTKIENNIPGVYAIVNTLNNKKYIGSSNNLRKRYRQHYNSLVKNIHHNIHLQNAFNKYGEKVFEFWILETCENVRDTILFLEQKYINSDGDYNICKLATHPCGEVYCGHPISEEHRKIIAESNKRRIWTKEQRAHKSEMMKNSDLNKKQRKRVIKLTLNGEFLEEFDSVTSAAKSVGGGNKRIVIKDCCHNKRGRKTAYGFKWIFKDDYEINNQQRNNC